MIDGKRPFDLEAAKKVLATFAENADKSKPLYPDTSKTGGDTAALPAIWENKADFEAKLTKFATESKAAAGRDHQPRYLQGADRRGPQELRRLPHALSQEGVVTPPPLRGSSGVAASLGRSPRRRPPLEFWQRGFRGMRLRPRMATAVRPSVCG